MHYKEVKISIMSDMYVFHQVTPNLVIITYTKRLWGCCVQAKRERVIVNTFKTSGIYVISIE